MKRNYDSLDLVKFIFAICIVALHADALYDVSPLVNQLFVGGIARLGVPFFFVTSAFFFFGKPLTWEGTKKYCKRLLTLYVAWFIISLPKTVFDRFICSSAGIVETTFLFARSFFVTSTFSGSWFIVSCIFCALLFYWLEKQNETARKVLTIGLSVLVYLWIVFTSAYGNLMNILGWEPFYSVYFLFFGSPYCSFLVGIPYFALGRYFAKRDDAKPVFSKTKLICGTVVSALLLFAEVYWTYSAELNKSTDCYLMLLPTMFFFFQLIQGWDLHLKHAKTLRIASTLIFFSQFWLLFICEIAEWVFKITIPCFGKFLFAIVFAGIFVWIVLTLENRKGFRWLRYLY